MFSSYFLVVFTSLSVIGLMPAMSNSLDRPPREFAMLISAFSLSYCVMALVGPQILAGWSQRGILLLGLSGMSFWTFMLAMAPTLPLMLAARVGQGTLGALAGPMVSALAARLSKPERRGFALATAIAGTTAAMVVGVPFAAWFSGLYNWRFLVAGTGVAGIGLCLWVLRTVPANSGEPVGPGFPAIWQLMNRRDIGPVLLSTVAWTMGQFALYTLLAPFLDYRFGLGVDDLAVSLIGFGIAGLVGGPVSGWLTDRLGRRRALRWGGMANLAAYVALVVVPASGPAAMLVLMTLWGFACACWPAPQQKYLADVSGAAFPVVASINAAALYAGMAGGGLLSAGAMRFGGFALLCAIAVTASASALFLIEFAQRSSARASD